MSLIPLLLAGLVPMVAVAGSARAGPWSAEGYRGGGAPPVAAGVMLVAAEHLTDPNFAETVVLLLDHGDQGSVGVVVNRPSGLQVAELLPQIEGFQERKDELWVGGPVGTGMVTTLVSAEGGISGAHEIAAGASVVEDAERLGRLLADEVPEGRLRVFAGHAGWGPGQLRAELERGDWHVVAARERWIFAEQPTTLWGELIRLVLAPVA